MKKIILFYIFCFSVLSIQAQQNAYSWRVSAYSGFNIYRGDLNSELNPFQVSHPLNDLSYENRFDLLSYGASIEYNTKGFGLKLLGTHGIFRAEDRAVNHDGDFISHSNFNRSLNVETQLYDVALLVTFYGDNGKFLPKTAFVTPYISIGLGGTAFETFGDLQDANGNTYHYWSDGKIYNYPELSMPPFPAEELTRDFEYETDLETLDPEGIFYPNLVWNLPLAIGLKFRITDRLNANLEVLGRYTSTDYLDGVSTRGNADDNDFYGMTTLSVHYNFGRKSEDFLPPTFYSLGDEGNTIRKEVETTTELKVEIDTPKVETSKTEINKEEVEIVEVPKIEVDTLKVETPKTEINKEKIEIVEVSKIEVDTPKVETSKTEINKEKIEIVEVPKIEVDTPKLELEITETPIFLLNDKNFSVEKQTYLEVQQTRLEVAELNEEANALLENYDATKADSFAVLNQKIDMLNEKLEAHQQYIIQLAIQGNANYTKPENQAIEKQVSSLEEETEALRQKYRVLVLGEKQPEIIESELEKIQKENEANKAKIAALEAEVATLEKQKITAKLEPITEQKPKTEPILEKVESTKIEKSKVERNIENIVVAPVKVDTTQTTFRGSATGNTVIPILSDSMQQVVNIYETKLNTLSTEIDRLNTEVIPQKDQTIQFLNTKVVALQGELKGIKETNKYYADLFQKQIVELQTEIAKLNKKEIVPTVKTETKVVEKILQVPAPTKAINLQDLVKDFGVANIYFDNGSTVVKSEFNNNLNRVVSMMQQHPEIIVVLNGYTDKSGNPEANLRLSKKRAETVKSYLVRQGISTSRIDVGYFGQNTATATNDAFSRRVEVKMIVN